LELTPVLGENIECLITNDDIAPTVTIHKDVVGSNAPPSSFQMLLGGVEARSKTWRFQSRPTRRSRSPKSKTPTTCSTIECVDSDDPELAPLDNPLS
jgi:hypothetical protein